MASYKVKVFLTLDDEGFVQADSPKEAEEWVLQEWAISDRYVIRELHIRELVEVED